jgi:hypothetical protein
MADAACNVVVSANGNCGPDAVPLYQAGETEIACIIEMEALGQLSVSRSSGDSCGEGAASYGCVTITGGVVKKGVQAQSGQAYIVGQTIHIGRCS